MAYVRSIRRYTNPESRVDQVGKKTSCDGDIDSETEDYLRLTGMHRPDDGEGDHSFPYDFGVQYDWSVKKTEKVSEHGDLPFFVKSSSDRRFTRFSRNPTVLCDLPIFREIGQCSAVCLFFEKLDSTRQFHYFSKNWTVLGDLHVFRFP